jgi:hypothetical protein
VVVDQVLYGRMFGTIQSYDLMDNPKYQRIETLLRIMNSIFGFSEDFSSLIFNHITDDDLSAARRTTGGITQGS